MTPDPTSPPLAQAPWRQTPVSAAGIPAKTLADWKANRLVNHCPILFPYRTPGRKVRGANFYGGWAVVWDVAGKRGEDGKGRGAFLLAGNLPAGGRGEAWSTVKGYVDGSTLGYDRKGQADLQITGVNCTYQLRTDDVRQLLAFVGSLRWVHGH